jgi:hypothetical protein
MATLPAAMPGRAQRSEAMAFRCRGGEAVRGDLAANAPRQLLIRVEPGRGRRGRLRHRRCVWQRRRDDDDRSVFVCRECRAVVVVPRRREPRRSRGQRCLRWCDRHRLDPRVVGQSQRDARASVFERVAQPRCRRARSDGRRRRTFQPKSRPGNFPSRQNRRQPIRRQHPARLRQRFRVGRPAHRSFH